MTDPIRRARPPSSVRYYPEMIQGSEEWLEIRRGMMTASELDRLLTSTLRPSKNDKARAHVWELAAQRISGYTEPQYMSYEMMKGHEAEQTVRELYADNFAPVEQCGFVTNDKFGFTLGCSPDGLVDTPDNTGGYGLIEIKTQMQRKHVQTLVEYAATGEVPAEFVLQVQGQLLVTEREWCDVLCYHGGLPMMPMRVFPDEDVQRAIIDAASDAEVRIKRILASYNAIDILGTRDSKLVPTERVVEQEMVI